MEGSIGVGKIAENKSQTYGFDAQTEQYVDMLNAGIVDPAKVVRVALQDAASIAGSSRSAVRFAVRIASLPQRLTARRRIARAAPGPNGGPGICRFTQFSDL